MKIYLNLYSPYKRYLFYLHGRCVEVHNVYGRFHIHLSHYDRKTVKNDKEHFPIVGEISEKEITEFILKKVVNK
jgi:hypothetical protein